MRQVQKNSSADVAQLPTASEYVELLNALQRAQEEGTVEALAIDRRIRALVPSGLYAGYLDDVGTRVSVCKVLTIQRQHGSANLHAFYLELQEFKDGHPVGAMRRMELVDFLRDVRRQGCSDSQHTGRRFWTADGT